MSTETTDNTDALRARIAGLEAALREIARTERLGQAVYEVPYGHRAALLARRTLDPEGCPCPEGCEELRHCTGRCRALGEEARGG